MSATSSAGPPAHFPASTSSSTNTAPTAGSLLSTHTNTPSPGLPGSAATTSSTSSSGVPTSGSSAGDAGRKSVLPAWCRELHLAPTLYQQIFLKCCPSGQTLVDTHLVYPILMASGLNRIVLKEIWTTSNRMTAGKLNRIELYIALGLVALAQVLTIDCVSLLCFNLCLILLLSPDQLVLGALHFKPSSAGR